jgi:protein-tyrosine-phosphatase
MKKSTFLISLAIFMIATGFRYNLGSDSKLYPELEKLFSSSKRKFVNISNERETKLIKITQLIARKKTKQKEANIVFVSKNNAGTNLVAQVLLQSALSFYDITKVKSFSAGLASSDIDGRVVEHLTKSGFKSSGTNSKIELKYNDTESVSIFSKKLDDSSLPQTDFYSVVICPEGKSACQASPGSEYIVELALPELTEIKDNAEFDKVYSQIVTEMAFVAFKLKEMQIK